MAGFPVVGGGGGGTVTAVTGTAPIDSSGGTAPVLSISAATTSAAGSMSAADKTFLNELAAVLSSTGSGNLSVTAASVFNQPSAGNGPETSTTTTTTSGATPSSTSFAVPSNTSGPVDVIVSAVNTADGGSQSWRGKVVNIGGTLTVVSAFASVDTWNGSSGASTWTVSVAASGVDVVTTVTASSGAGTVEWTIVYQYVSAQN